VEIRLTTTGRRTGKPREVPLYAWEDGARLVVVGSSAGRPRDPHWAQNLRAEPRATVTRGTASQPVQASEATGTERTRLWKLVVARFPLYETYQGQTERTIPLFVLEPVAKGR
jgi:deazaflavin-dependent oxidoreductase (nitroreductase family)